MSGVVELPNVRHRARPIVLIAEDESMLRQLYAEHLTMSGFDVIEVSNGAEALHHSSTFLPDLILMDLSMPIVDGWEATQRLKADTRTAHIPVLALTAFDGAVEIQRATLAGFEWFVPKPCPPSALVAEIRRVLSDSRS